MWLIRDYTDQAFMSKGASNEFLTWPGQWLLNHVFTTTLEAAKHINEIQLLSTSESSCPG
jgi:hypothetical protein